MTYRIGFLADHGSGNTEAVPERQPASAEPRRSLVGVYFPQRNINLTYYNDKFDLHVGDFVYVDGKLEGLRGRVTEVNYSFRIRLSDYKRVIALVDTEVHGEFFSARSFFVTLDPNALPKEKIRLWYLSPENPDDEYVSETDWSKIFNLASLDKDDAFSVLKELGISTAAAERGHDYYDEDRVRYICINRGHGYAIVQGSEPYEVEFFYSGAGNISGLTCSCYCSGTCKHEFAMLLQLHDILVAADFPDYSELPDYFAAIYNADLFSNTIIGKKDSRLTL